MAKTVICTFRVRKDSEDAFLALLQEQWPLLARHGLVTDRPPQRLRAEDGTGAPVVVEIFEWRSSEAASAAHEHPEIQPLWAKMAELVEERGGRPQWEFPHFERLDLA